MSHSNFKGKRQFLVFCISMNLKKYFGFACFFLGILVIHVKPQLSTTGYVYDPISGNDEENNLSSERFIAYHDCWELGECGYVAKRRSDRKYVKLKIGATLNETNYSIIWKKRVEGKRNFCLSNRSNKGKHFPET